MDVPGTHQAQAHAEHMTVMTLTRMRCVALAVAEPAQTYTHKGKEEEREGNQIILWLLESSSLSLSYSSSSASLDAWSASTVARKRNLQGMLLTKYLKAALSYRASRTWFLKQRSTICHQRQRQLTQQWCKSPKMELRYLNHSKTMILNLVLDSLSTTSPICHFKENL